MTKVTKTYIQTHQNHENRKLSHISPLPLVVFVFVVVSQRHHGATPGGTELRLRWYL